MTMITAQLIASMNACSSLEDIARLKEIVKAIEIQADLTATLHFALGQKVEFEPEINAPYGYTGTIKSISKNGKISMILDNPMGRLQRSKQSYSIGANQLYRGMARFMQPKQTYA